MQARTAEQLIRDTDTLLEKAIREARRSSTAVVTHMICQSTRQIMQQYFTSFLLMSGKDPNQSKSLVGLKEQCVEVDPRFEQIELSNLDVCYKEDCTKDGIYCLPVEKVTACLKVASQTKALIGQILSR